MSQNDNRIIFCLTGASLILVFDLISSAYKSSDDYGPQILAAAKASNPLFRTALIFSYMFFACGICVEVFTKYEINYIHIFELTHTNRVTDTELYKLACIFFFIFCFGLKIRWESDWESFVENEMPYYRHLAKQYDHLICLRMKRFLK